MKKRIRRKLGEGEFYIARYNELTGKTRWLTREESKNLLIIADWHDNIRYCTKAEPMPEDGMSGRHSQEYHWVHKDGVLVEDNYNSACFDAYKCPYCGTMTYQSKPSKTPWEY